MVIVLRQTHYSKLVRILLIFQTFIPVVPQLHFHCLVCFLNFSREEFNDDKYAYENLIDVAQRTGVRIIWRDNNSGGSKGIADRVKDVRYFDGKRV